MIKLTDVRRWHFADMAVSDFCFLEQTCSRLAETSVFDPTATLAGYRSVALGFGTA